MAWPIYVCRYMSALQIHVSTAVQIHVSTADTCQHGSDVSTSGIGSEYDHCNYDVNPKTNIYVFQVSDLKKKTRYFIF